jgi:O-antigen/teichoic acid export membrane protein
LEKPALVISSAASSGLAATVWRAMAVLRSPLYANALCLWASAGLTAVSGLAFWALVTRLCDAGDVGLGSAALSAVSLLALFSHLGLGLGLIRSLPEAGARGPRLTNAVFTTSALSAAALALVFLLGLPLWAPSLEFLLEQPLYPLVFVALVVGAAFTTVQMYAFTAIRRANYFLVQVSFLFLGRLALPALLVGFFGAFGIVAAGGLAAALAAVVGFALLAKGLAGYRPRAVFDAASVFKLLPFSAANYISDSLLLTPGLVLPLIVVGLLGSAEGAYFYMAWFLGYLLTSGSTSLALSLFAEGSYDPGALRRLSRNAVVAGLGAATAGAVFFVLLGDRLLLVFGHDYAAEGANVLRIVALAAIPAAVVNVYLGTLRVTRRVGELVVVAAIVGVTTVAVSSALLPTMGLTGAAAGHAVGQALGLAIVVARLLSSGRGTLAHRSRRLLATVADASGTERRVSLESVEVAEPDSWTPEPGDRAERRVLEAKTQRGLTITALICTLNEEENLPHVLPRIPAWVDELVLVDGRSTDGTVAVAGGLRPDAKIVHQRGWGKGDALKCGMEQATGDIIVTLDADGTTDPHDLPRFIEPLLRGCDFVKGSRFALSRPAGKPRHRVFGNWIIVATYNVLFGARYTDLCSGYNAFWRQAMARVDLSGWSCQEEPLLNARVKKAGLRVLEVGHHDKGRLAGETKQPSWRQGFGAFRTVIRERFRG